MSPHPTSWGGDIIKQIRDKVTLAIRKCKSNGKTFTAGEILHPGFVDKLTVQNDGYRVLRTIRGSPPYWEQAKRDVFAMIRQLGIPTWFCSFSAAETKWAPLLQSLHKLVHSTDLTVEDTENLSWKAKCDLIKADPVTCACYFDFRVQTFIKNVLKHASNPVGEVIDYFYRVEFQQRGSPHIHMLIWIKDAPEFGKASVKEVTCFVDSFITYSRDESMPVLVNYHTHRHAKTCCKQGKSVCRFSFPLPPMPSTVVLQPLGSTHNKIVHAQNYEKVMAVLNSLHKERKNLPFSEFLTHLNLTYDEYILSVRSSIKTDKIFLKRSLSDNRVNNYNTVLLKSWQANMDIQYILDPYACVSYIVSYIAKGQRGLSNLLQQACKEAREQDSDIRQQVRRIGNQFLSHVEIGAQEAAYLVLQMPLRRCTRDVIFVDTNKLKNRTVLLKSFTDLKELPQSSKNVEVDNVLKRYKRRPKSLEALCYADFASWYEVCTRAKKSEVSNQGGSELPETDYDLDTTDNIDNNDKLKSGKEIEFCDGTVVRKRQTQKVIYHHFTSLNTDKEEHYREQIMLYTNWRNEDRELLRGHDSYETCYQELEVEILAKRSQYEKTERAVFEHLSEDEEVNSELCAFVDSEKQHIELIDQEETPVPSQMFGCFDPGPASINNSETYDLGQDIGIGRKQVSNDVLPSREIDNGVFLDMASKLNDCQLAFFYHILHWTKTRSEPIYTFLSGGAGVGKSVVLKLLYQALLKYLNHSKNEDPSSCKILLCAPTGKAAHNIGGNTIHSAFCIPANQKYEFKPLDMQQLNAMRCRFRDLKFVFIDEVSMVGRSLFNYISMRLQEIMGSKQPFGGVSVLAFGDLFQLRPVKDSWIFSKKYSASNLNGLATHIWADFFTMYELTEIMRQKEDHAFAQLLNRLREGNQTQQDMCVLRSRSISSLDMTVNDIKHLPHLFCKKDQVESHNDSVLLQMPISQKVLIEAIDTVSGNFSRPLQEKILTKVPSDTNKTMGLQKTLHLGLHMPAELTVNVYVSDGLTNGAACVIKKFDYRVEGSSRCSIIWVEFLCVSIGQMWKTKYKHLYVSGIPQTWVPILETCLKFPLHFYKTYLIVRRQFPLQIAAAKTIHKSQGSTMQVAALHFGSRKTDHVHYVGLSRLTHLSGIHILALNADKISVSSEVVDEMLRLRHERPLQLCVPDLRQIDHESVKISFQNCRSLHKHVESIKNDRNLLCADIIAFAETRLFHPLDEAYAVQGFNVFCARKEEAPHGIAVYHRNHLVFQAVTVSGIEYALTRLENGVFVCFFYCPPKFENIVNFQGFLGSLVQQVLCSERLVLMGDVNEDFLTTRCISDYVCNVLSGKQLLNTVTTDYGSCLDHIYTSSALTNSQTHTYGTLESYYSDHKPIFIVVNR